MRPWVVSSTKSTATGTGATGITIARPGGVRRGDVLYAFLCRAEDTGSSAFACTGWTSLLNVTSSTGNDIRGSVLRKVCTGGEPAEFTFTNDAGDSINMTGLIVLVRGADVNTPEDVTSTSTTGSNDFTPASIAVTPTSGHALILTAHGASMDSGVSGKTGGAPSGFTLIDFAEEATAAGFESFIEVARLDQTNPASSGTGAWTGTANDATSEFVTMSVAVRCGKPILNPAALLPVVISEVAQFVTDTLLGGDVATQQEYRPIEDTLLGGDEATGWVLSGDPIEYLAVESVSDVPGWTLRLAEPLLFKPVEGDTHVPGWFTFVDDPLNDPNMTADVYLLEDLVADPLGAIPLVTLDQCTDPDDARSERAWDWRDEKNDPGAGSITLAVNDPDLAVFDTDDLLAVAFNMYGMRVFVMVIEDEDAVEISDQDEVAEAVRFSGRGTGVILELGTVDPTGGPYRSPVEEDRVFGWSGVGFDHTAWPQSEVLGTVQDAIVYGALLLVGFTEPLGELIEDLERTIDANWPSRQTLLLWSYPQGNMYPAGHLGIDTVPPGDVYFYEEFNITAAGDYNVYFMMDDRGIGYIDGQQVAQIGGINFLGITSVPVTLSAGFHTIAAVVTNQDFTGVFGQGWNPGKYGWVITTEATDVARFVASIAGEEIEADIVAQAAGTCLALGYPTGVPGQAITKTLRIAIEETQLRGYLPGITLGFTDTTFTDGRPVLVLPDVGTKVGGSILAFVMELAQTYIDWELDPATLVLNVWEKGTQGLDTAAVFDVGPDQGIAGEAEDVTANIVSLRRKRERRKVSRFLLKWPGGWAERVGVAGGTEVPLELGSAPSLEEVLRLADGQFAIFGDPRTQFDVGIAPEQRDDAPYLGWRKADRITYNEILEVVVALTVETNNDVPEDPTITATLRDVIQTPEERQANDLRSIL